MLIDLFRTTEGIKGNPSKKEMHIFVGTSHVEVSQRGGRKEAEKIVVKYHLRKGSVYASFYTR